MPLYEYQCEMCKYSEDFLESSEGFHVHACPKCIVKCNNWVKYESNGGLVKSSEVYVKSYIDSQEGSTEGKEVAMKRLVGSKAKIISTGYKPTDARYSRGKGRY